MAAHSHWCKDMGETFPGVKVGGVLEFDCSTCAMPVGDAMIMIFQEVEYEEESESESELIETEVSMDGGTGAVTVGAGTTSKTGEGGRGLSRVGTRSARDSREERLEVAVNGDRAISRVGVDTPSD
jgi:hypothetical protein